MKPIQLTFDFFSMPTKPKAVQPESYSNPKFKPFKGQRVKYNSDGQIFEVQSFSDWCVYFVCGHWCTDNVFIDLIEI